MKFRLFIDYITNSFDLTVQSNRRLNGEIRLLINREVPYSSPDQSYRAECTKYFVNYAYLLIRLKQHTRTQCDCICIELDDHPEQGVVNPRPELFLRVFTNLSSLTVLKTDRNLRGSIMFNNLSFCRIIDVTVK